MFVNTTNQSLISLYEDLMPIRQQSPVKRKGIFHTKPNSQCFAKIPFTMSDYSRHPFLRKILAAPKTYDFDPQIENSDEELFSAYIAICDGQEGLCHRIKKVGYQEDESSAVETNTNSFIEETKVRTKSIQKSRRKYTVSQKRSQKA